MMMIQLVQSKNWLLRSYDIETCLTTLSIQWNNKPRNSINAYQRANKTGNILCSMHYYDQNSKTKNPTEI